jgi:tetrahydrodipicolinate N-succinyltransferase
MDEARKARAKVRERERAIWNHVETIEREARTANGAKVRASATAAAGTEPNREKQGQTLSSGS